MSKINKQTEAKLNKQFPKNHYDKHGKPIGLGTWARLIGDTKYKRIGRYEAPWGLVSTVWIDLDMGLLIGIGNPLIFETMVFDVTGTSLHEARWHTIEAAKEGHKIIVKEWREKMGRHQKSNTASRKAKYTRQFSRTKANKEKHVKRIESRKDFKKK